MSQMVKENEFASDKNFDDITKFKDGGVKKKILRSGKGTRPTEFAECEIQYIGYFTNGKVWINTYRSYEKSVTFQMKKKKVIYGWEIACMSMKKGEKARFKISSAYAYGANGNPPHIPPDTNLVFDIELVDWKSLRNRKDKFMEKTNQSYEELVAGAEKEKEAGNELFKEGEYHEAISRYDEAIQYARFVYEPKLRHTTRPLMQSCELNKAFCHLKLKNWRDCIKCCDEVLKNDAHEPKAFYRKAVAFRMMGQDAEAKKNILQAKRLCADDPGIDREMTLIEWQWEQRRKKERKIFMNLFDEEKQAELSEKAETALSQGPIKFKEDKARLKKIDHVSLPGEDAALDKWGGSISDDLPRGNPKMKFNFDDEEQEEGKDKADDADMPPLESLDRKNEEVDVSEDDDMPPLESVARPKEKQKKEEAADDDIPPLENVSKKVQQKEEDDDEDDDMPPLETVSRPKKKEEAKVERKLVQERQAPASLAPSSKQEGDDDEDEYVYDNSVTNPANPKVYMRFAIQGESSGKVIVELFEDRVPKSAKLFRKLCEKGYPGTKMTRYVPDYVLQGGDLGDTGFFTKERTDIPLDQEGLLCVAAEGSSQFFFTLVDCSHLNGEYCVIGKVIDGIEVLLEDIAVVEVDDKDQPKKNIVIKSTGEWIEDDDI